MGARKVQGKKEDDRDSRPDNGENRNDQHDGTVHAADCEDPCDDAGGNAATTGGSRARANNDFVVVSFDIGVKNLACCVLGLDHTGSRGGKVLFWRIMPLAAEKERIPTLNELSGRIFMVLDDLVSKLEETHGIETIDLVLLENQPSRLNGAMKSLQMMIYSYFQLRRHWEGRVTAVQMVSASQKTLGHGESCVIPSPESKGYKAKKGYELNKWNAIWIARHYIQGDAELSAHFESHKKKDDLADALCQVLAWARKHGHPELTCVKKDLKDMCESN